VNRGAKHLQHKDTTVNRQQHSDVIDRQSADLDVVEKPAMLSRVGGSGEVDIQVATAKKYPRAVSQFKSRALAMATLDMETAESCFYALPRGGKTIEGPSARLAEIVASAWGNLRVDARVIDEDERFVYSEAVAWDLEANVAIRYSARRRITDKNNRKFNDDMIAVTANAACSIALRNAVFKVVPMAYVRPIWDACKKVAVGDAKTLADRRAVMMAHFQKMGLTPDRILAVIERKAVEDVTLEDLAKLKGLATAIKDGDTDIDQAFPAIVTTPPGTPGEKTSFGFKGKAQAGKPATAAPPANMDPATGEVPVDAPADADDPLGGEPDMNLLRGDPNEA